MGAEVVFLVQALAHSCTVINVAHGSGLGEDTCENSILGANQNVVVAAFVSFQPSVLSSEDEMSQDEEWKV